MAEVSQGLFELKANEMLPVLGSVASVVDDLASDQAGVAVEDLHRLRVALHAPVVDAGLRHEGNLEERKQKIKYISFYIKL
jgi:hypothetical protein